MLLISLFFYSQNSSYIIIKPKTNFHIQPIKFIKNKSIINCELYCDKCLKITKELTNLYRDNKLLKLYCCMYYKFTCKQLLIYHFSSSIIKKIFNYAKIPYFTKYILLTEIPSVSQQDLNKVLTNIVYQNS